MRAIRPLLQQKIHQMLESKALFPVFAAALLAVLWGLTFNLIQIERAGADRAARAFTVELTDTYEAQVVRVLREIDQDLKLIQYAFTEEFAQSRGRDTLAVLAARNLLPPGFIYNISLFDSAGTRVAGTGLDASLPLELAQVEVHRDTDILHMALPQQSAAGVWTLQFSRRLSTPAGEFAGVVVMAVDAAFFVSSYEPGKMGQQAELGLLGMDDQFKVRQVGTTVSAGATLDYQSLLQNMSADQTRAMLAVSPIDGVARYVAARELYDFPLAVVMGLAQAEQLAPAAQRAQTYIGRATIASAVVLLVVGVLWRLSWRLAQIRRQEMDAQVAHAAQIEYLAYHDGLTGLPNRSLFSKLLNQSILQAQRNKRRLGVLFLDLDHFKQINDTLGHDAGDQLLQEVAARLQSCLRKSDTVARLGGDEFVVVLPDITNEEYPAVVARKIIAAVARPYLLSGQDFRVTASIGVSIYPYAGEDEQTLTKNADIAMYKAKEEGKNNFQIYSPTLHTESLDRLSLESALRHALERRELQLEYQPKRDMASGQITGVEALLRWQHPDLGVIAPLRFLQVAEDIGLLIPIGRWVLNTVCAQNMLWQQQGLPRVHMAINLTARQFFCESLPADISAALAASGMDAALLELEVSEGVLLQNIDKALAVIKRLKVIGVRIAIDNFGVGYSSLSMLKQFPLDVIKIDRSFIRDISDAEEDGSLAEAIVAMGRQLGMTVVAQGVETQQQVDFLRGHACDEVQGFYYNKPLLADECAALFGVASARPASEGRR